MQNYQVFALLEELSLLIEESKSPVGKPNCKIIDFNTVYDLIAAIYDVLPKEFEGAAAIVKNEQNIIGEAKRQAEVIVQDAQRRAQIAASQEEIVRIATIQHEEIMAEARRYSRDTQDGANRYAHDCLTQLNTQLGQISQIITGYIAQIDGSAAQQNDVGMGGSQYDQMGSSMGSPMGSSMGAPMGAPVGGQMYDSLSDPYDSMNGMNGMNGSMGMGGSQYDTMGGQYDQMGGQMGGQMYDYR